MLSSNSLFPFIINNKKMVAVRDQKIFFCHKKGYPSKTWGRYTEVNYGVKRWLVSYVWQWDYEYPSYSENYAMILQRNKTTRLKKMEQTQAAFYVPVHESPSFPCIHSSPFTIFKCLLCCCHCLVNISQWSRRYTGYYLSKGSIVLAQTERHAEC